MELCSAQSLDRSAIHRQLSKMAAIQWVTTLPVYLPLPLVGDVDIEKTGLQQKVVIASC